MPKVIVMATVETADELLARVLSERAGERQWARQNNARRRRQGDAVKAPSSSPRCVALPSLGSRASSAAPSVSGASALSNLRRRIRSAGCRTASSDVLSRGACSSEQRSDASPRPAACSPKAALRLSEASVRSLQATAAPPPPPRDAVRASVAEFERLEREVGHWVTQVDDAPALDSSRPPNEHAADQVAEQRAVVPAASQWLHDARSVVAAPRLPPAPRRRTALPEHHAAGLPPLPLPRTTVGGLPPRRRAKSAVGQRRVGFDMQATNGDVFVAQNGVSFAVAPTCADDDADSTGAFVNGPATDTAAWQPTAEELPQPEVAHADARSPVAPAPAKAPGGYTTGLTWKEAALLKAIAESNRRIGAHDAAVAHRQTKL
jgi:hypothetical protein